MKKLVNAASFWDNNIMGSNFCLTKIEHLEKFMQNIPLNIFSRIPSANKQGQINNN